jgi:hypothetical protein
MKKIFDTTIAMQSITSTNSDLSTEQLEVMENAMVQYNDAEIALDDDFIDGYTLLDLITDYGLVLYESPVTTRLVKVYDNGGKTIDRYTVIIQTTGHVYGCSDAPQHPQGVGTYCGNVCELIYGHGRDFYYNKKGKIIPYWIRLANSEFKKRCVKLGEHSIKYNRLPVAVQVYISSLTN